MKGTLNIRIEDEMLRDLDEWRKKQPGEMSRGAAIRHAVKKLLEGQWPKSPVTIRKPAPFAIEEPYDPLGPHS